MPEMYVAAAAFLLVTVALALLRVVNGPTPSDRLIAVQLTGSGGVATLLLLAEGLGTVAFLDVAVVLALLAAVLTVAFVRLRGRPDDGGGPR